MGKFDIGTLKPVGAVYFHSYVLEMKVETQSYPSSKTPNSIPCMPQTYFPSPVLLTNLFKSFVQIASRGCAVCLKTVLSDLPQVWFFDSGSTVNDSIVKMCSHFWFPALRTLHHDLPWESLLSLWKLLPPPLPRHGSSFPCTAWRMNSSTVFMALEHQ